MEGAILVSQKQDPLIPRLLGYAGRFVFSGILITSPFALPSDVVRVGDELNRLTPTEIRLNLEADNLFGSSNATHKVIIIDKKVQKQQLADEKKRLAKIAAEKARQQANLTVTSGSQWGTAKKLYYSATLGFNCVSYAKAKSGIYRTMGWGGQAAIQGYTPKVGAVGALKGYPHAVYITAINGNQITFTESNYISGWITQRTLPSSYFLGYIYN